MFSPDFYPTPSNVIDLMLQGENLTGKSVLEPSAGKGNIVSWLLENGVGSVIACEKDPDLQKILGTKCQIIADDFFSLESHQISHIDLIIMNPPFSDADKHIIHAFEIAPPGCRIIALCNKQTLENLYSETRRGLKRLVENYGNKEELGKCFTNAERMTNVEVSLIRLSKPGENYDQEFSGFFLDEDPEEQANGIISYNVVRDLVNRYVAAIKIFDDQLEAAVKMNIVVDTFFKSKFAMSITQDGKTSKRNEFKKDLQKSAWSYIFEKLNMQKYATRGLKEDINKFVEKQQHIPFTMANVYRMLEIVIGTQEARIDKAILEVFDSITKHHDENRYNVEGWKTNSHYLLTKKFIHPGLFRTGWSGQMEVTHYSEKYGLIDDLHKALCYITGKSFDDIGSFWAFNNREENKTFNTWYEFGFFRVKGFKKGTAHLEFKDEEMWAKFNLQVSKLKGYPLYEPKTYTKWQEKHYGRQTGKKAEKVKQSVKPVILASFKMAV